MNMKKILPIIIAGFSLAAYSQEIPDALRYSQDNLNGTARFRAMSGAFGALGGDFSSIMINPAGSAIFTNNQVGLTLSSYNLHNTAGYFGTNAKEDDNTFDLNQGGGVYVLENDDDKSGWKKITFAMNYENMNNFDNSWFSAGTNPNNSIANYFLAYANSGGGVPLNILQNNYYEDLNYADAQAFLGYQGYVINPVSENGNNSQYVSNVPGGGNYYQENAFTSTGYNGKLAFNIGAQYTDRFYFGLNLNSHFTDYRQSTSFYEENSNDDTSGLQRVRFNNDLYTYGSGFSFQLGTIVKVTKSLRFGLAYQSPTWYRLNDEISQSLVSVHVDPDTNTPATAAVDPGVTMVYDTYKLNSPSKWTGSLAYVFGKEGLISVDCSMKDYSNTKFRPDHEFTGVNQAMENQLDQNAFEVRVGAEKKYKQWSFRGGYRWEESPYANNLTMSDLNGFSGGLGYNFGDVKLDVAYSHSKRLTRQGFFDPVFNDAPTISNVANNVSVTLLFEL